MKSMWPCVCVRACACFWWKWVLARFSRRLFPKLGRKQNFLLIHLVFFFNKYSRAWFCVVLALKMNLISKEFLDNQLKKKKTKSRIECTGAQLMNSALQKSKCTEDNDLIKSIYRACEFSSFHFLVIILVFEVFVFFPNLFAYIWCQWVIVISQKIVKEEKNIN